MAISDHYGREARGEQPEWSIDDVQMAIAQQIGTYNKKLSDGGPQFSVTQDPVDSSLEVQVDGSSILIVVADDMLPGEFVLLKPYAFKEPPLGGGKPDQRFFSEVRAILMEAVRGELMPGVSLDDDEEPPADTGAGGPGGEGPGGGWSEDDWKRFLNENGLN